MSPAVTKYFYVILFNIVSLDWHCIVIVVMCLKDYGAVTNALVSSVPYAGGFIFVMYEITSFRLTLERKMSCVNIVNMGSSEAQPFSPSISHTMALYNGVYPTGKQSSPICPDR